MKWLHDVVQEEATWDNLLIEYWDSPIIEGWENALIVYIVIIGRRRIYCLPLEVC